MRWFIALVIIVGIVIYFMRSSPPTPKRQVVTPAIANPVPPHALQPMPAAATPAPRVTPLTLQTIIARMGQVASATGVQLRGVQPQPGGAQVTVSWISDNTTLGADFLQQCTQQGIIRTFDESRIKLSQVMEGGRQTWVAQYSVSF